MIEIEDGDGVEELAVLFVEPTETEEFPGIQGDYQVEFCIVKGLLHAFDAGQEGEIARRAVGAGGYAGFALHFQDMRQAKRRADAIAIGAFVRDQENALRRFNESQRSLYKNGIKLGIQPVSRVIHRFLPHYHPPLLPLWLEISLAWRVPTPVRLRE